MTEEQETLGSYLRRERKKRDVSIEQIAYATRISLKMLTALEEDQHQLLPAQPFVRGYLQAYAKYVHLDSKDVLLRYQHHLATQPVTPAWTTRTGFEDQEANSSERRRLVWITAGLVALLLGSGSYMWLKGKLQEENARALNRAPILKNIGVAKNDSTQISVLDPKEQTVPLAGAGKIEVAGKSVDPLAELNKTQTPKISESKKTAPVEVKPSAKITPTATPPVKPETSAATKPEPAVKPQPAPPEAPPEPEPAAADNTPKKYNLTLKAKEDVWLRFQADTEEVKDLILRKDKAITIRANKLIKMFSGNVKAISGNLNGQHLDALTQGEWKRSVVIPFTEIPNVNLPLFPGSGEAANEGTRPSPKREAKANSDSNE